MGTKPVDWIDVDCRVVHFVANCDGWKTSWLFQLPQT